MIDDQLQSVYLVLYILVSLSAFLVPSCRVFHHLTSRAGHLSVFAFGYKLLCNSRSQKAFRTLSAQVTWFSLSGGMLQFWLICITKIYLASSQSSISNWSASVFFLDVSGVISYMAVSISSRYNVINIPEVSVLWQRIKDHKYNFGSLHHTKSR